jgi:hypothetical protein
MAYPIIAFTSRKSAIPFAELVAVARLTAGMEPAASKRLLGDTRVLQVSLHDDVAAMKISPTVASAMAR